MAHRFWPIALSSLCLSGLASSAWAEEIWQAKGGATSISLYQALGRDVGASIVNIRTTAKPVTDMEDPSGFALASGTSYSFRVRQGGHREVIGGGFTQTGGFTVVINGRRYKIENYSIQPRGIIGADGYVLRAPATGDLPLFNLTSAQVFVDQKKASLMIGYMDMTVTPEFARVSGKPSLSGQLLGSLTIMADITKLKGSDTGPVPPMNGGPDLPTDVLLDDLTAFQSSGRIGTYPNGRSGFAMQTRSCNNSTTIGIDWYNPNQGGSPMDQRHPYIMQNLYRLSGGKFEMIGWAWAKHGFFATNESSCAGGSCSTGGGHILGPKCTDTYGVGNNNDRNYLGPREEINPLAGTWITMNSFFANYSGNVWNSAHGSGWNAVDHRIDTRDQDLLNTSGTDQFFYEGYYVCKDDINTYNNLGSRRVTLTWSGSTWTTSTVDAKIFGTAVQNRWPGSTNAIATPQADGDVIVAVKTTDLGGGVHNYEYAVYNHNSDRAINEFSIPIIPGAVITNVGYHDLDIDPANDWTPATVAGSGVIRFVGPSYADLPNGNALRYSRLFNFRFNANVPPVASRASLGVFKPGVQQVLTAAVSGPTYGYFGPFGYTIIQGVPAGGNLASLNVVDASRLGIQCDEFSPNAEIDIVTRSISATASEIRFKLVASASRTDFIQQIQLFNYVTTSFEAPADTRAATIGDSTVEIVVSSNAGRLINPTDLAMKSKITWTPIAETTDYDGWGPAINQANWKVTP